MATIRTRSGKLFVDFRYMGARCREKTYMADTAVNRKRLAKIVERMEAEITLGTFKYAEYFPKSRKAIEMKERESYVATVRSKSPTFREFSEIWFGEHEIEWRASYQRKLRTTLDNHILPALGSVALDQIQKGDLLAFRASLAKVNHGKGQGGLTASRINQIMTPVRMILQEAADRYGFETPYKGIKNLKEKKPEVMPFTLEEAWLIIRGVRQDFSNYYLTRFFTGMRTSEIDALRWRNVNLRRREIHITEALVDGQLGEPKTQGSNRVIQLSEVVYQALSEQHAITGKKSKFVFCNRFGEPLEYRNVNRRVWHPTLALLGLEPRRAYQTRHTAATLWLAAGENPEWIARQLGHSNTEMLFRVYSRYVPDVTRKDGSAFDNLLKASQLQEEPTHGSY